MTTDSNKQKGLVIVSHSLDEAITHCIYNNKKKIPTNVTIVLIEELMRDFEVFDELSDSGTIIQWYKGQELYLSNRANFLLNRVLHIPSTLFANFKKVDKEYAQHELAAYLGFSFNAFSGVGNQCANGVCGEMLSLPCQWQKIKKKFAINVPNYYWGPINGNCLNKKALIYTHVYNFFNWSITDKQAKEKHVFCFEKPQGIPVFIFSIGNQQLITAENALSAELAAKLKKLAREINKDFNYFISEILIFVEGVSLNFGCINQEVIRSTNNSQFDNFVCNNLLNEFYKWMN